MADRHPHELFASQLPLAYQFGNDRINDDLQSLVSSLVASPHDSLDEWHDLLHQHLVLDVEDGVFDDPERDVGELVFHQQWG